MSSIEKVVKSGIYLNGTELQGFESEYSDFIGTKHTVGCGNGLDALTLILTAYRHLGRLKEGDEVLVPANTFIASILAIYRVRMKPVLVDPEPSTANISAKRIRECLTPHTRAVILVHLYGRCAYSQEIAELCKDNNLILIEDNAQAHGAVYSNEESQFHTGSLGDAAAHSFYPAKNLGALADGGAVTTDDSLLAKTIRMLSNYGSDTKYHFPAQGYNSRLDEIQSSILRIKLKTLDADNRHRNKISDIYQKRIYNPMITMLSRPDPLTSVDHIFPIFTANRIRLQRFLHENGVETLCHYPIPPSGQPGYSQLKQYHTPVSDQLHATELSLPISPVMQEEDAEYICMLVNKYH